MERDGIPFARTRERHSFRFRAGNQRPVVEANLSTDSIRFGYRMDGNGTNAAIIDSVKHSTLFRSRETDRETIDENQ